MPRGMLHGACIASEVLFVFALVKAVDGRVGGSKWSCTGIEVNLPSLGIPYALTVKLPSSRTQKGYEVDNYAVVLSDLQEERTLTLDAKNLGVWKMGIYSAEQLEEMDDAFERMHEKERMSFRILGVSSCWKVVATFKEMHKCALLVHYLILERQEVARIREEACLQSKIPDFIANLLQE